MKFVYNKINLHNKTCIIETHTIKPVYNRAHNRIHNKLYNRVYNRIYNRVYDKVNN